MVATFDDAALQAETTVASTATASLQINVAVNGDAGLAFGIVLGERLHQADAPHPLLRAGRKR